MGDTSKQASGETLISAAKSLPRLMSLWLEVGMWDEFAEASQLIGNNNRWDLITLSSLFVSPEIRRPVLRVLESGDEAKVNEMKLKLKSAWSQFEKNGLSFIQDKTSRDDLGKYEKEGMPALYYAITHGWPIFALEELAKFSPAPSPVDMWDAFLNSFNHQFVDNQGVVYFMLDNAPKECYFVKNDFFAILIEKYPMEINGKNIFMPNRMAMLSKLGEEGCHAEAVFYPEFIAEIKDQKNSAVVAICRRLESIFPSFVYGVSPEGSLADEAIISGVAEAFKYTMELGLPVQRENIEFGLMQANLRPLMASMTEKVLSSIALNGAEPLSLQKLGRPRL